MYEVLKKRNERKFYIISLVIQLLYGAMVFFCYKLFDGENTGMLLCVGVAGLLLTFLCMTLNTVAYVLQKEKKDEDL